MIKRIALLAGILMLPLASTLPAFAESQAEGSEVQIDENQAIMNAKISIADAIRAAEAEGKGKAVDSGLNDENGTVSYQVEVLAPDGKRTDIFVDLQTGKVLKMADAGTGEGDQQNENDEEGAGENGGEGQGENNNN